MPENQAVIPMLSYENGPAAMEWLERAFGFVTLERWLDENGRLSHGEMRAGDGLIMLATPTPDYESPAHHREHCEAARKWLESPWVLDGVLVYVDDIDEHHGRAVSEGARVLGAIEDDFPGRRYRVEDIEGHRWMFLQKSD